MADYAKKMASQRIAKGRTEKRMQNHAAEQAVILIPSLEPDNQLPAYIRKLKEGGFAHIIVVDDGSGEDYRRIFEDAASVEDTVVLFHEVNKGKGVALKTGYRYISEHLPDINGVITADADGQHTVEDCLHLAEALENGNKALYLGSRDFNLENVPPKSRSGNKITSAVFKLLYGQYLPDTQTGLRAFRKEELPFMMQVEGERYEYEMKVLIACSRAGIPMIPVTIETIYENDNEGTHFHPIRDSWRIYKVLLGSFLKFMGSSLICVLVDQVLSNVLLHWLFPLLHVHLQWKLPLGLKLDNTSLANYTARLISAVLNFKLNKSLVFKVKGQRGAALKYAVTAVAIVILSTLGIKALMHAGLSFTIAKIITDTVLYFVSYRLQQRWVFREEEPHE